MRRKAYRKLLSVVCAGMLLFGCGNTKSPETVTPENEKQQAETGSDTEDEKRLDEKSVFYRKTGDTIEKYSVCSGIVKQEELSDAEISEQQLDELIDGRILVWQDSFGGSELDLSAWECEEGYKRNEELQYYTSDGSNLSLDKGVLRITAKNEKKYEGFDWTSASIKTSGKKQFLKGRLEAKVRFTNTTGQLGMFWTVGAWAGVNWPVCGEVNIGEQTGDSASGYYKLTSTIHYAGPDGTHQYEAGEAHSYNNQLSDQDYHILAAEWTDDKIAIYVDDDNYVTYNIRDPYYYRPVEKSGAQINPFLLPHYLQLNLAVQPVENISQSDPMVMEVDWVRVYAQEDVSDIQEMIPGKLGIDFLHNVADAAKISRSDMEYVGRVNDKVYLGAVYLPDTVVDRSCIFAVDNTELAQITQSGVLTVQGEGRVVVTATDKTTGITASRAINLRIH